MYLFNRKIDPAAKAALVADGYPGAMQIKSQLGVAPVLNLMFFFEPSVRSCNVPQLLSYTAVFQKSEDFPFDAAANSPINFSIGSSNHGISSLTCGFGTGAPVHIRVRRSWDAERSMFPTLLPPGRNSMLFTWDIEFRGEVLRGK